MTGLNWWQELLYFGRASVVSFLLLSFGCRLNSNLFERKDKENDDTQVGYFLRFHLRNTLRLHCLNPQDNYKVPV